MTPDEANDRALPFAKLMGVRFTHTDPDRIEAALMVRADLCTRPDVAHGGAIMSLADTVGAVATMVNLPQGATGTTTIESKTNFVAAAPAGTTLIARALPVHRGRRTQVWQVRVETEAGRLVALTTQTQLAL